MEKIVCPDCNHELDTVIVERSECRKFLIDYEKAVITNISDEIWEESDIAYRCPNCDSLNVDESFVRFSFPVITTSNVSPEPRKKIVTAQGVAHIPEKPAEVALNKEPECPYCHLPLTKIGTSSSRYIIFKDGKWSDSEEDLYEVLQCLNCYTELGAKDLDELGVPEDLR
jgi:ssDNA-binding Zn-finger/Zn-ribbon topoisomerase 1